MRQSESSILFNAFTSIKILQIDRASLLDSLDAIVRMVNVKVQDCYVFGPLPSIDCSYIIFDDFLIAFSLLKN